MKNIRKSAAADDMKRKTKDYSYKNRLFCLTNMIKYLIASGM